MRRRREGKKGGEGKERKPKHPEMECQGHGAPGAGGSDVNPDPSVSHVGYVPVTGRR